MIHIISLRIWVSESFKKNSHGVINKTFSSMMEQLGYYIEVTYVNRKY